MNDSVPLTQAESVESLRAKAVARADAGDESGPLKIFRPKRKRAYHRALKRGEPWAVWQKTTKDMFDLIKEALFTSKEERMEMIGLNQALYSSTVDKKDD